MKQFSRCSRNVDSMIVLALPVRENARQLIQEHSRADVLRAHGYEPRHRLLLSGPPGNGKTSCAEAVAEALALPFFVARYDALIGSFLGETNARLRALVIRTDLSRWALVGSFATLADDRGRAMRHVFLRRQGSAGKSTTVYYASSIASIPNSPCFHQPTVRQHTSRGPTRLAR